MNARKWTDKQRQQQSEKLAMLRPWVLSTGPTTEAGKNKVSRNAWKGGHRPALREMARQLKAYGKELQRFDGPDFSYEKT